jgi:hypothetical protein
MKTPVHWIVLAVALTAAMTGKAHSEPGSPAKVAHVIIIGVDGMSPDGVLRADTPNLDDMMKHGSWSMHARGVLPTISAANWASMLNAVGPEQHGVTDNEWQVGEFNFPASVTGSGGFFPSIFQLIFDQHPDWEVGSIYHWTGFGSLYDKRFVDYDVNAKDEDETAALAVAYIEAKKPALLFVHLDHVDHAGHADGHGSPGYYQSVAKADRLIGEMRQAVKDAGIEGETVILVTSDHGGIGKGHGGQSLAELEIPWIAYGSAIKPGHQLDLPISTIDTPATAAWLLGVERPYAWMGRPISSVVLGAPAPAQTYRTSSFYAAPVITPNTDGHADAGGLFVDGPAKMTISNPNDIGEIRYTLDNSIPDAASPIYEGPVDIARSTIVRAGLFVDGKLASSLSRGYFRILEAEGREARGVTYSVYVLPDPIARLPDFARLKPVATGVSHEMSIADVKLPTEDNVAVVFSGFIEIATAGDYRFALASDDGSKLYIDGKPVVDNDGSHGVIMANGGVTLQPGRHAITVEWFNGGGGAWLGAYFEGPGIPRQYIDPNLLTVR